MNKKPGAKKMLLNRETVRTLDREELRQVEGAGSAFCSNTVCQCGSLKSWPRICNFTVSADTSFAP